MLVRITTVLAVLAAASALLDPPSLFQCDSAGDLRLACRADAIALEQWRLLAAKDAREQARDARQLAKTSEDASEQARALIFISAMAVVVLICYALHAARRVPPIIQDPSHT